MTEANSEQQKFQSFYQRLIGDIENTKRRQWLVPYYILLLFAAIIGFVSLSNLSKEAMCVVQIPLSVLALVIAIAGTWHIIDAHLIQVKYRRQIYKLETRNLHYTYGFLRFDKKSLRIGYYFLSFTLFFYIVVLVGLFCALTSLDIPLFCRHISIVICAVFGSGAFLYKYKKLEKEWPMPS